VEPIRTETPSESTPLENTEHLGPFLLLTKILELFAKASKWVCASPEQLSEARKTLEKATAHLVHPYASAAKEGLTLWDRWSVHFSKTRTLREREELSQAFCAALEIIGQRFDLPLLNIPWADLPTYTSAEALLEETTLALPQPVSSNPKKPFQQNALTHTTLEWLTHLDAHTLQYTLQKLVGKGVLNRSDTRLLLHHMQKNTPIGNEDVLLVEIIEKIGGWIATQPS
jgi:hypothetical protein